MVLKDFQRPLERSEQLVGFGAARTSGDALPSLLDNPAPLVHRTSRRSDLVVEVPHVHMLAGSAGWS